MRDRSSGRARPARLALLAAVACLTAAATARAQLPQPYVPSTNLRSGLITRSAGLPAVLPHDPDRDTFYGTRWSEPKPGHPNHYARSGLYGLHLSTRHTESRYPFFRGAPGQSSINPDTRQVRGLNRFFGNFVHPFKPVGMYYQSGSYVPIYDLDPLVTGPGPFPWPFFYNGNRGG